MDSRLPRAARLAQRGLALFVAFLLTSAGVVQAAHGADAASARTVVAGCDGGHEGAAIHAALPAAHQHDEARCAFCQAFTHARVFLQPPALLPPVAPFSALVALVDDGVSCADPVTRAHPPRAPPRQGLSAA